MADEKSPFWRIQGLATCPVEEDHNCPEPEAWFTLFHLSNRTEAQGALVFVMDSDSSIYDNFDDFRICPPDEKKQEQWRAHTGYAWERSEPKRRRTPTPARPTPSNVVPITDAKSAKKGKKHKKGKKKDKVK